MSLIMMPDQPTILLRDLRIKNMRDVAPEAAASGWKVSLKRGMIAGVGASVSGQGAWVKLKGSATFTIKSLEKSQNFQQMKNGYNISGGVSGFWSWIGLGVNASTHKEDIRRTFQEVVNSQSVRGKIDIDLMVTGLYPNVQVDASSYVFALQITDNQGNKTNVISDGDPVNDTGAQDTDGDKLPTSDNETTITL